MFAIERLIGKPDSGFATAAVLQSYHLEMIADLSLVFTGVSAASLIGDSGVPNFGWISNSGREGNGQHKGSVIWEASTPEPGILESAQGFLSKKYPELEGLAPEDLEQIIDDFDD